MFQSLSGLSLGLNRLVEEKTEASKKHVSIPFRAVTGFEPFQMPEDNPLQVGISIPFRAVTGFERAGRYVLTSPYSFQSLSGLSLGLNLVQGNDLDRMSDVFQSLSGLSLGLNAQSVSGICSVMGSVSIPFRAVTGFEPKFSPFVDKIRRVSIPFRAVTGFEPATSMLLNLRVGLFQSLSGLSLGLNKSKCKMRSGCLERFQSLSGLSLGLNEP